MIEEGMIDDEESWPLLRSCLDLLENALAVFVTASQMGEDLGGGGPVEADFYLFGIVGDDFWCREIVVHFGMEGDEFE